jgi:protein TonB
MNSLQPYLVRSGVLHLLGLGLFVALSVLNRAPARKNYYTIDFLGGAPAGSLESAAPTKPAPAALKKEAPQALPSLKRWLPKARAATLRESEMAVKAKPGEKAAPPAVQEPAQMAPTRQEPTAQPVAGSGGTGGADIIADPLAFPFPWYLARLRSALWATWSQRMPGGGRMCMVSFVIARNGSVSEVGVSDGSLDSDFDYAAMASVQEAAPFPPLPEDFPDASLKVHVKFQSL